MDTKVTQTHTTSAVSVLEHADLVRVLGLAVMLDAGLPRDAPGTTVTADLVPADVSGGQFRATVSVLIDHNATATPPAGGPSLNSGSTDAPAEAASGAAQAPQIPGAPSA